MTKQSILPAGFALISGTLLVLALLFFINVLANYRADVTEPRPQLVVELTAWPTPIKQQVKPPVPQPKKQPTPKKPTAEKAPPPPKPKLAPLAKERSKEIPPEPMADEPVERVVEKVTATEEPQPTEPTPPMLVAPTENALPTPVPIFKLTQAPRFLHRETPAYPEAMRSQGRSGLVKLEALIDKTGRVREVNILTSAGKAFDRAAKQAILASSFYPAEVDNQPVAVLLRLPVKFELR